MWVRFPQGAPGQKRHLKRCLFCCLVPGIWLRQMPPPAGGTSARFARSMCGRNLRFPHTRPLPSLGGGSYTMRVCAANSLACQGQALAMLRFPLTLLFPSDPLGLRAASLPKANSFGLPGAVPAMLRSPTHAPPKNDTFGCLFLAQAPFGCRPLRRGRPLALLALCVVGTYGSPTHAPSLHWAGVPALHFRN